ncbi:DUF2563 family protein [Mycolicibacterium mengxianglii]|uniref:DUF2563 family protein n=1 Tax=Mycolicibacterium mengxianglii TaxID=2736649 RepID=UPI0018EF2828|nr:DUF2563 family protein [Mycolicibacterium mengxianglii]
MSEGGYVVFVDFDGLRSGASTSYAAADRASEGAGRLARANVATSLFGDFAEAQKFQQALSAAHNRHVSLAEQHCTSLGAIGDQAHVARSTFIDMDEKHTAVLRDVY